MTTEDADRQQVLDAVETLLRDFPPATTSRRDFLNAQFDAGLAWVNFPPGRGGLGVTRSLQPDVDERLAAAGAPSGRAGNPLVGSRRDIADSGHMADNFEAVEVDIGFGIRAAPEFNGAPGSRERRSHVGHLALAQHFDLNGRRGRSVIVKRNNLDEQLSGPHRPDHETSARLP